MADDPIRVYWKNVTSEVIGPEHGLPADELREAGQSVGEAVDELRAEYNAGKLRFCNLPDDRKTAAAVQAACDFWAGQTANLVVLGIGGSALGNIALQTALNSPTYNLLDADGRSGPRLFVVDNVDPVQFGSLLDLLAPDLEHTLFNVISKSGQTAETASQLLIVRRMLADKLGRDKARDRILVTTDPAGGTMRDIVQNEGYRSLPVPEGVGGRFSVLSPVGLFSAAMCGIDITSLLAGAQRMRERVFQSDWRQNPAALLAAIHYLYHAKGKHLSVMMPYSFQLKDLADWWRQLWAESLGKRYTLAGDEVFAGLTPIKALGVTDQHSQLQLYREGPNDKVFTFLQVDRFDRDVPIPDELGQFDAAAYLHGHSLAELLAAEKTGTEYALIDSKRPNLTVRFPRVDAGSVGEFIMLYEMTTAITARLFEVNAFDQPAVELGKQATFALLGRPGHEELAGRIAPLKQADEAYLV